MHDHDDGSPERVLVLAPTGRDGAMVYGRIVSDGLECALCEDLDALLAAMAEGAGAVVVALEALSAEGAHRLLAALEAQEPWSDLPVLLLSEAAHGARAHARQLVADARLFERANVTLLQRPLGMPLFSSSVRAAVRARRRQYQMRDLYRELEHAVELRDLFASILGHDLRNPLGAVHLGAQAILEGSTDARALRPAARILSSASRMARMIEQLLDFARARKGIPVQVGVMHLGELIHRMVEEIEDAHPAAEIEVHAHGDLTGVWDADRLAQVLTNLVGNAVQHGDRQHPIEIEVDGREAARVRVLVHNAGVIPASAIPMLFEPFKPSDVVKSRSGLGLGLFIAREIARAHGGDIRLMSHAERTTFEVSLPRDARPVASPALHAQPPQAS